MRVTIRKSTTVGDLQRRTANTYGPVAALQRHVRAHPRDTVAKVALHDAKLYAGSPPSTPIEETRHVIIPDRAVDRLTAQRLQLLVAMKGLGGEAHGLRALARALGRDVKNVSEDVHELRQLGLLDVTRGGAGKASRIALPGDVMDLHLVEA